MLLNQLKSLLQSHKLWAKKRLGQNFLVDENVYEKILSAADLKPGDHVIEVGPGTGFLTERLLKRGVKVTAIEKDRDMIGILNQRFLIEKNLDLVYGDALHIPPPAGKAPYKVVANIPYYITSPLIKHFLQSAHRPELMVILVQKEVAEKICGTTGKSIITIETCLYGQPEIIADVARDAFFPSPKVDSAILKIVVPKKPPAAKKDVEKIVRMAKFGFSQKRKKLRNSLAAGLRISTQEAEKALNEIGIDPAARPEDLEIKDWLLIAGGFFDKI